MPKIMPSFTKLNNNQDEEVDIHKMARDELQYLHRQYRLTEDQRHGYYVNANVQEGQFAQVAAGKQYRIVELLQEEKASLQTDLLNATCTQYNLKAKDAESLILEFLTRFEGYQLEIQKQIKSIEEMETQVDKIHDRVLKQKLKILSLYGLSISTDRAERKLASLEDRLYHVRTLFDEKASQNIQIRMEISDFLRERTRFHKRHNFLKRKIADVKIQMLQVVQHAVTTYDARDDAMIKIKALREREHKESKQHGLEIKEFQRVLHHDRKIHQFLVEKNKFRPVLEDAAAAAARKEDQKEFEVDELLLKYKQSIKNILSMSSEWSFQSVGKLCSFYNDLEQQNFSKFKYITDLNHECDVLKEAIQIIKQEIESASDIIKGRKVTRAMVLQNYQKRIFEQQDELKYFETMIDINLEKLDKLVQGVSVAFDLAECSNSNVLRLLGNRQGVSTRNIKLCLSILDYKITNIKHEKSALEVRKAIEIEGRNIQNNKGAYINQPGFAKRMNKGGPFKVEILIPNRFGGDGEEDNDDAEKVMRERPYYYHEMKEYVSMQMKEGGLLQQENFETPSEVTFANSVVQTVQEGSEMSLVGKVSSRKSYMRILANQEQEKFLNQMKAKGIIVVEDKEINVINYPENE